MDGTFLDNPLVFWKQNSNEFPILSAFSKQIFSITASSAEPERHCSAAGLTVNDFQSMLTPEHLEELIFANEGFKNGL